MHDIITMSRITKTYPDGTIALNEVDLQIGQKDWVFVVGENGAGKSTMLRLLTREDIPTSGHILIEGRNINRLARNELAYLRRKVACIWQSIRLIPNKTVWENVAFSLEVRTVPRGMIRTIVDRTLDFVEMSEFRDRFPHQLSGGEAQRVAIARAIALPPKVLVADEPSSNLSPVQRDKLLNILRRIHQEHGCTIVIATHDMDMVNMERRRVVFMEHGRIIADAQGATYPHKMRGVRASQVPVGVGEFAEVV